jgi:hypothetical protein
MRALRRDDSEHGVLGGDEHAAQCWEALPVILDVKGEALAAGLDAEGVAEGGGAGSVRQSLLVAGPQVLDHELDYFGRLVDGLVIVPELLCGANSDGVVVAVDIRDSDGVNGDLEELCGYA